VFIETEQKSNWQDWLATHNIQDWINVIPETASTLRSDYDLRSYPKLLLLGKNKEILSKQFSAEDLQTLLDYHLGN
jgi:hypothetical protein